MSTEWLAIIAGVVVALIAAPLLILAVMADEDRGRHRADDHEVLLDDDRGDHLDDDQGDGDD